MKPEQLVMFDLPPVTEAPLQPAMAKTSPEEKAPRKRAKQLSLDVKLYRVSSFTGECTIQARSPSAAKYLAFKMAKESGLYLYEGGFLAFVGGGVKVAEVRK